MLFQLRKPTSIWKLSTAAFVSCLTVGLGSASAAPKLHIDKSVFDFGSVSEGTVVTGDFLLRNVGSSPLEIQRIQPACGCTVAKSEQLQIAPGEESRLEVTFDTTGFTGEKLKTVRLYTNDVEDGSAVVTLRGSVQPEVTVDPLRVYFGEVQKGATPSRSFVVGAAAGSGIEILQVASRSSSLELSTQEFNDGKRKGKQVTVSLRPGIPIGNFRGRVVVRTSSKRDPIVNVNVFAKVSGDFEITPLDASFGLIEAPNQPHAVRTVQLKNRTAQPITIRSVDTENPQVQATLRTLTAGSLYEVEIALLSEVPGVVRSRVKVTTDSPDPEQQTIEIPVYAVVNRKSE